MKDNHSHGQHHESHKEPQPEEKAESEHIHPMTHEVHGEKPPLEMARRETAVHAGHEGHIPAMMAGKPSAHTDHHSHMIKDFKKRFFVSLVITIPILLLSPLIQGLLGLRDMLGLERGLYVLWGLSSAVYLYGGYPFLKGLVDELKQKTPGMMTLVSLAITVAYVYSSAVVFGLKGEIFFWELATLIDIMLLGHWVEMRSVLGASKALEELARLMPSVAHKILPDGSTRDVPLESLAVGDKVLIKPERRFRLTVRS